MNWKLPSNVRKEEIMKLSAIGNATYYLALQMFRVLEKLDGTKSGCLYRTACNLEKAGSKIKNQGEWYFTHKFTPDVFYPGGEFVEKMVETFIKEYCEELESRLVAEDEWDEGMFDLLEELETISIEEADE